MSEVENLAPRIATVWLDGCSGCHMSFLDMDERLLTSLGLRPRLQPAGGREGISRRAWISPWSKALSAARTICTRFAGSRTHEDSGLLGDCAVTANVPAMRNPFRHQSGL